MYAHGGASPIATLSDSGYDPYACSFDPSTGNLAVANYSTYLGGSSPGNVAVYPSARGDPTDYTDDELWRYFNCGYDNKGDLFLDGLDDTQHSVFAELPKGSGTFEPVESVYCIASKTMTEFFRERASST